METTKVFTIAQELCDSYGHLNNASYAQLLEEGRWDLVERNGAGREAVAETGQGPAVLELKMRFRRELKPGDRVEIRTKVTGRRSRSIQVEQTIYDPEGKPACEAEVVLVLFDLKTRGVAIPHPRWKKAMGLDQDPPAA